MKEIVILGGGFAGVAAVLALKKNTNPSQVQITLVDKNPYHLFTPSLYEVATAEEPKSNICIPYSEIFPHGIQLIKAKFLAIDKDNQKVKLSNSVLRYDYLIIALGAETQYYDIEGLKEYSIAFKSLEEGCEIRDRIKEKYYQKLRNNEILKIAIGGGGTTGVELATEIAKYVERLGGNAEIDIFQKSGSLLKGVTPQVSKIAHERLEKADIKVHLNSGVKKVTKELLEIDGKGHPYDIFIWTGGVKPNSVIEESDFPKTFEGRLDVDGYLKVKGFGNVFAAGDVTPYTAVVQVAEEQGKVAGENVVRKIDNKPLIPYKYRHFGYIIPLSGFYAVVHTKRFTITGFLGFLIYQLAFLRYLLGILPLYKAFRRWNRFEEYLMR